MGGLKERTKDTLLLLFVLLSERSDKTIVGRRVEA